MEGYTMLRKVAEGFFRVPLEFHLANLSQNWLNLLDAFVGSPDRAVCERPNL